MCGIAGFYQQKKIADKASMEAMLACMRSRGPDDQGVWQEGSMTMGHLRLSILDLSAAGHQPMTSASGRYVMTYNGEVYNHQDIRRQLQQNLPYKGHSDTETLLHAMDHWGIEATLKQCVGMFALGVWDRQAEMLYLVRDPMGIKPLYYGWSQGSLVFASQLNAFKRFPNFESSIDEKAMALYFKYNYVPAPYAIYKHCFKQRPGTILSFYKGQLVGEQSYWSLKEAYQKGRDNSLSYVQAKQAIEDQLQQAINRQLVADVPVGVFLSGGIDSSLITALAASQKDNIQTFSIGFEEARYNEAPYAKAIAQYLGTQHTEEYLPISKAIDLLESLHALSDEPFGDPSQLPTYLLCQLARKYVTVALSGDGGDELFAGYQRYADVTKLRRFQSWVPESFQGLASNIVSSMACITNNQTRYKLHMASKALREKDIVMQYDGLFDFWPHAAQQTLGPTKLEGMNDAEYMCFHDMSLYLPGDILTKVDRCSMAVSLETRLPFLDHPVVEESFRVPTFFKLGAQGLKLILKDILSKYVPADLTERPKQGFSLPVDEWIRGPLKSWAMDMWSQIVRDADVDQKILIQCMDEHQKGQCNWQYAIWNMLMWQQWKNASG